jgi:hypothetical protein
MTNPAVPKLAAYSDNELCRAGQLAEAKTWEGWLAACTHLNGGDPSKRVLQIFAQNDDAHPSSVEVLAHLAQDPTITALSNYPDRVLSEGASKPGVRNYRT